MDGLADSRVFLFFSPSHLLAAVFYFSLLTPTTDYRDLKYCERFEGEKLWNITRIFYDPPRYVEPGSGMVGFLPALVQFRDFTPPVTHHLVLVSYMCYVQLHDYAQGSLKL